MLESNRKDLNRGFISSSMVARDLSWLEATDLVIILSCAPLQEQVSIQTSSATSSVTYHSSIISSLSWCNSLMSCARGSGVRQ